MHLYHGTLLRGHHICGVVRLSFFPASFPALSLSRTLLSFQVSRGPLVTLSRATLLTSFSGLLFLPAFWTFPSHLFCQSSLQDPVAFEHVPSGALSPKNINGGNVVNEGRSLGVHLGAERFLITLPITACRWLPTCKARSLY